MEVGIKPDELFIIVQHANMSKLWEDGKPHYAKDGKTIKPKLLEGPYNKLQAAIEKMKGK